MKSQYSAYANEKKAQYIINTIGDEAIMTKVAIWYQVYIDGGKTVFGFSTKEGVIQNFPDRNMIGNRVTDHKKWFRENKAEVVKISEQILS